MHDIFTGKWTTATSSESAAGYNPANPVSAALGIINSIRPLYAREKLDFGIHLDCKTLFGILSTPPTAIPTGTDYTSIYLKYITALGISANVNLGQDKFCQGVSDYPFTAYDATNAGLYLYYDKTNARCDIQNVNIDTTVKNLPTNYHAFRVADLRFCNADNKETSF